MRDMIPHAKQLGFYDFEQFIQLHPNESFDDFTQQHGQDHFTQTFAEFYVLNK